MMITKGLFSSNKQDWETPQDLFNEIDEEYPISFDLAANNNNKHVNFFSPEEDSLKQDWNDLRKYGENGFLNPPYSNFIVPFIKKAAETTNIRIIALLPARTDTRWFHDFIYKRENTEIRFLKGRLKFSNSKTAAPFPSMIVIFNIKL